MTREELRERLEGDRHYSITGMSTPKDSISLDALVDIFLLLLESPQSKTEKVPVRELKPGVSRTVNGKYFKRGKGGGFISEAEAFV